jgi:DNA-binding transcriptional regulator YiaG
MDRIKNRRIELEQPRRRTAECDYCHLEMPERKATMEKPYNYKISGLKDVCLVGIVVKECPKCGYEIPIIPRIGELNDLIARTIVKEPRPLRGDEIKFLRKIAGFPAQKFAVLLGITPQHLSRFENGHTGRLGKVSDRLARFIAIKSKDGEDLREVFLQVADKLASRAGDTKARPAEENTCFELDKSGWKAAA